jgi:hypothetical protein
VISSAKPTIKKWRKYYRREEHVIWRSSPPLYLSAGNDSALFLYILNNTGYKRERGGEMGSISNRN